jgi:hypothetical protein
MDHAEEGAENTGLGHGESQLEMRVGMKVGRMGSVQIVEKMPRREQDS